MEINLPITDKAFVENLIPQKHPFVMVSELISFSENTLISKLTILPENILTQNGYFLASGIIEHQAQSVALHTGYQFYLKGLEAPTGFIGAIKTAEIFELPAINDTIETHITILNEMMGVTLVKTETFLNGKEIAHSEMKTVVKE